MSAAACPTCGAELDRSRRGSFAGVCPRCLLADLAVELSTPDLGRIGTRLGRHEILGLAGAGGMGTVYVARQDGLDREVALKILGKLAGERDVERFQREARALARLRHPGIVAVHEVGSEEGLHYYTMDLLRGRTLADEVAEGPLEPRRAAAIVRSVALAIAHAHENGIVHRDLKSSNILLAEDGEPVVADFGLALDLREDHQLTRTGTAVGTGPYMAPEQVSKKHGSVGPATDVYGLGAVLYECLTGAPPFWDDDLWELFRKVQFDAPIPPWVLQRQADRGISAIALAAIEKEPGRRYASARAMAEDLSVYLDEGPKAVEVRLGRDRSRRRRERLFLRGCRVLSVALPLVALALAVLGVRGIDQEHRRLDRVGTAVATRGVAPILDEVAAAPEGASLDAFERRLKDEALREPLRVFFLVLCRDGTPVLSSATLPEGLLAKVALAPAEGIGEGVRRADVAHMLEPGEDKDALRAFGIESSAGSRWTGWAILSRRDLVGKTTRFLQAAGLFVALFVLVLVPVLVSRSGSSRAAGPIP